MTPRHILPTSLFLIALSLTGTWAALDAASREQAQAERIRLAQVASEPACMRFCPDCPEFCPPAIREANAIGRVQANRKDFGRSGLHASVLIKEGRR
jgi:hypothetical protein